MRRYFKVRVTRLPLVFNFNLVLASCHHDLWERQKTDARIVHYTIYKARRLSNSRMLRESACHKTFSVPILADPLVVKLSLTPRHNLVCPSS
jgi:hypothetical protein